MTEHDERPVGQLTDDQLTTIVLRLVREAGLRPPLDVGAVVRLVSREVAGRADGRRVITAVERCARRFRTGELGT